jgi:hypothetical protein
VFKYMQNNGTIAFFWTVHVPQYDQLFSDIREVYRQFAPHLDDSKAPTPQQVIQERKEMTAGTRLFKDLEVKQYAWQQKYSAREWIALLNTNSRHRLLEEDNRNKLFQGVEEAIHHHGGMFEKSQLAALYLGRKP